jgi:hypothetical protein
MGLAGPKGPLKSGDDPRITARIVATAANPKQRPIRTCESMARDNPGTPDSVAAALNSLAVIR